MQNSREKIMDLITQLSTEDIRLLVADTFRYLTLREREDITQLLLENQDLRYKNMCRLEQLEENGIADPFGQEDLYRQDVYI